MKTNTRSNMLTYLKQQGPASPHQLQLHFGLSAAAIHRQLRKLETNGSILKIGSAPKVLYAALEKSITLPAVTNLPQDIADMIEARYTYVNPDGVMMEGVAGFVHWVEKTGQFAQLPALAREYVKLRQEADQWYQGRSWIDATSKLQQTFLETTINHVAYADFYALPKFGKTRLGAYTLHAKVSQNRPLMQLLAEEVKPIVAQLISEWNIQAVAFIPHSIPRKLPLLPTLASELGLSLPLITIEKLYAGKIKVPQKSLSKLQDRVENAQKTLYVKGEVPWDRVLLIDDAVGSGATFNEVAQKIKSQYKTVFVAGFAIVGSYKGFEVISEV